MEHGVAWRFGFLIFSAAVGEAATAHAPQAPNVVGVDFWDCATAAYQANFPKARAINLQLDENTTASALGDIGRVDLLLASPECTSHTCARGSRPPVESSRLTARYVLKFAEELKPRWVVIENVTHMKGWQGYRPLLNSFASRGTTFAGSKSWTPLASGFRRCGSVCLYWLIENAFHLEYLVSAVGLRPRSPSSIPKARGIQSPCEAKDARKPHTRSCRSGHRRTRQGEAYF